MDVKKINKHIQEEIIKDEKDKNIKENITVALSKETKDRLLIIAEKKFAVPVSVSMVVRMMIEEEYKELEKLERAS